MNDTAPSSSRPDGHAHEAASARTAPLALWRVAEAFLRTLHAPFGAPEAVAERHTLTARAHTQLASWLRSCEALLRRLLLIEASAYEKPNTRPLLHTPRRRVRKLVGFDADAPEAWRVTFRVFATADRRRPAGKTALQRAGAYDDRNTECRLEAGGPQLRRQRFYSAWPLAERYEALIRVFNDPAPYARRLSRRLHATPHRIVEALRAPPEAEHRIERFGALARKARRAWRPYLSSA